MSILGKCTDCHEREAQTVSASEQPLCMRCYINRNGPRWEEEGKRQARAAEADAIVRELSTCNPVEEGETFVGFYCSVCGVVVEYDYDGFDASEHAAIRIKARDEFQHAGSCAYARARAYTKESP